MRKNGSKLAEIIDREYYKEKKMREKYQKEKEGQKNGKIKNRICEHKQYKTIQE